MTPPLDAVPHDSQAGFQLADLLVAFLEPGGVGRGVSSTIAHFRIFTSPYRPSGSVLR